MGQDRLSTHGNLFDFFHERVDHAVSECHVPVSRDGVYYITNLLVERSRARSRSEATRRSPFRGALAPQAEAVRVYRELGDEALYVSGFFRQSLERRIVGSATTRTWGQRSVRHALAALQSSRGRGRSGAGLLRAGREFVGCSEALAQIREGMRGKSDQDIIALYERWLSTGDQHAAARLRELGNRASGARTGVRRGNGQQFVLKLIQEHLQAIYRLATRPTSAPSCVREDVARVLGPDRRRAEEWVLVREVEDGVDIGVYIDADASRGSGDRARRRHGHSTRAFARSAWPPKA
jgi:hypothetical protein